MEADCDSAGQHHVTVWPRIYPCSIFCLGAAHCLGSSAANIKKKMYFYSNCCRLMIQFTLQKNIKKIKIKIKILSLPWLAWGAATSDETPLAGLRRSFVQSLRCKPILEIFSLTSFLAKVSSALTSWGELYAGIHRRWWQPSFSFQSYRCIL